MTLQVPKVRTILTYLVPVIFVAYLSLLGVVSYRNNQSLEKLGFKGQETQVANTLKWERKTGIPAIAVLINLHKGEIQNYLKAMNEKQLKEKQNKQEETK